MGIFEEQGLFTTESLVNFVEQCESDRMQGKYPAQVEEGDRLADEFRKTFPDVTDKDLGVLIVIITKVLGILGDTPAVKVGYALDILVGSYGFCAAKLLRGAIDLDSL